MSASYLPFNEPQGQDAPNHSGKAAVVALLLGFGLGCGVMYAAGGQPVPIDALNMAWAQPAQASRSMQPALPRYFMQPAGLRAQPVAASKSPREYDGEPMQGRREFMTGLASLATASALLKDPAAQAAYGDGANVFGGITNSLGAYPFAGDGFAILLPSKWNPSKEKDFNGVVLRYEDNGDAVNYLAVLKLPGGKLAGTPEEFLNKYSYLLGQQSYAGETMSEGGFAPNRVSAASVLDIEKSADKKGRTTYSYNILSRTQDGNEGGRHVLLKAVEAGSDLYILKIQIGDKRWFKGAKKDADLAFNSFTVA